MSCNSIPANLCHFVPGIFSVSLGLAFTVFSVYLDLFILFLLSIIKCSREDSEAQARDEAPMLSYSSFLSKGSLSRTSKK